MTAPIKYPVEGLTEKKGFVMAINSVEFISDCVRLLQRCNDTYKDFERKIPGL